MGYIKFFFSMLSFQNLVCIHTCIASPLGLATLQVFNNHRWPLAIILDNVNICPSLSIWGKAQRCSPNLFNPGFQFLFPSYQSCGHRQNSYFLELLYLKYLVKTVIHTWDSKCIISLYLKVPFFTKIISIEEDPCGVLMR